MIFSDSFQFNLSSKNISRLSVLELDFFNVSCAKFLAFLFLSELDFINVSCDKCIYFITFSELKDGKSAS